jgi:hypothetical protein
MGGVLSAAEPPANPAARFSGSMLQKGTRIGEQWSFIAAKGSGILLLSWHLAAVVFQIDGDWLKNSALRCDHW